MLARTALCVGGARVECGPAADGIAPQPCCQRPSVHLRLSAGAEGDVYGEAAARERQGGAAAEARPGGETKQT